jgi:PAS domain S-box-containing protein
MVLDSQLRRYSLAAISCGLALAVSWPFDSFASIYFLAVLVSSLHGGKGPGLLSVALSAVAYNYFWLPPQIHLSERFSYFRFAFFLGTTLAIVGLIEAKRHAEEARRRIALRVQKSESYLSEAEGLGHAGSWACTPHLAYTYFSAEMYPILGFPAGDAPPSAGDIGKRFAPEEWLRVRETFEAARREKIAWDGEFAIILPNGSGRAVRMVGHPVLGASGEVAEFVGTAIDVTEQRHARTALQQAFDEIKKSEDQLRTIIETIPGLVWCAAPEGEFNYLNRRMLEYTGTTLDVLGQLGWINFLYADDRAPVLAAWSHAVATGRTYEIQCRLRRSDGIYQWFHVLGQAARDNAGAITRWYGLLIDIDDRKNIEEALYGSEARLSRATQTATVGEFAASIAHEINQPLAAVVANGHACLRWLSAQPPGLAKAHEAAERIVRDGKEAGEVVRRIRALFKRAALEKIELDMNEVIGEVLRLLSGEAARRHVAVETDLAKNLASVTGDRVQLQQVIFNLLLNGIEAMDPVLDRPRKLFIRSNQHSPEAVLVEIRDCGVGLKDPEKVFEAFFTTKEDGMGMGLAICRSIIDAHHGRLWASPGQDAGAIFSFTLPAQLTTAP